MDKGGEYANVASAVYAKAYQAALETNGLLEAIASGNERYKQAIKLKDAAILAGGCTRKFGHAIGIFDDGVQTLRRIADGGGQPMEMQEMPEELRDLDRGGFDSRPRSDRRDAGQAGRAGVVRQPAVRTRPLGRDRLPLAFLQNASQTLFRLNQEWPSINPDMGGVNEVADGKMAMPHWGDPPEGNTLFKLDENGLDDLLREGVRARFRARQ